MARVRTAAADVTAWIEAHREFRRRAKEPIAAGAEVDESEFARRLEEIVERGGHRLDPRTAGDERLLRDATRVANRLALLESARRLAPDGSRREALRRALDEAWGPFAGRSYGYGLEVFEDRIGLVRELSTGNVFLGRQSDPWVRGMADYFATATNPLEEEDTALDGMRMVKTILGRLPGELEARLSAAEIDSDPLLRGTLEDRDLDPAGPDPFLISFPYHLVDVRIVRVPGWTDVPAHLEPMVPLVRYQLHAAAARRSILALARAVGPLDRESILRESGLESDVARAAVGHSIRLGLLEFDRHRGAWWEPGQAFELTAAGAAIAR